MKPLRDWVMVKGLEFVPRLKTSISSAVPLPAWTDSTVNALNRAVPSIAHTSRMKTIILARGDCLSFDIAHSPADLRFFRREGKPTRRNHCTDENTCVNPATLWSLTIHLSILDHRSIRT